MKNNMQKKFFIYDKTTYKITNIEKLAQLESLKNLKKDFISFRDNYNTWTSTYLEYQKKIKAINNRIASFKYELIQFDYAEPIKKGGK